MYIYTHILYIFILTKFKVTQKKSFTRNNNIFSNIKMITEIKPTIFILVTINDRKGAFQIHPNEVRAFFQVFSV